MNAKRNRPAERAALKTAGGLSTSSVAFRPSNLLACVRVDLTHPTTGEAFAFGEVRRRLYRAVVGLPAGATVQLVVGANTPSHDLELPRDARVQIVAPDSETLRRWITAVADMEVPRV